nr:hypothetical protein [uncultured Ruminococcus sp.]
MSLLIKGMDMPKQTEVQTDKGTLKLWTIRNWKVGQDVQFGAAKIPCDLSFNHDGTIHLSVLGRKYSLTEVSTPHGRLIDADDIDNITVVCTNRGTLKRIDAPTIIEAEE